MFVNTTLKYILNKALQHVLIKIVFAA